MREKTKVQEISSLVRSELAGQLHGTVAKDLARIAVMVQNAMLAHPAFAGELEPISDLAQRASKRIRPMIMDLDSTAKKENAAQAIERSAAMLSAPNKSIARALNLSEGSVRIYISELLSITGFSNRAELAVAAVRAGY
ncbi:LuxR C-terminal-related transcriptional regulator [Arcanobacterium hippocoleae]